MFTSNESNARLARNKIYTYVDGEALDSSKYEMIECGGFKIYVENEHTKKQISVKFQTAERQFWQTPNTGIIQDIITMAQSYCKHIKIFALDVMEVSDDSFAYHDPLFDEIRVPAAHRKFMQFFLHEITHATLELATTQSYYVPYGKTKLYQDQLRKAYCTDFNAYQKKREIHTYSQYENNIINNIFKIPHAEFYAKTEFRGERICNMIEAIFFDEKIALEIAPNYVNALHEYIQWEKDRMQPPNSHDIDYQVPVFENINSSDLHNPIPSIKSLTVSDVRKLGFSQKPQCFKYVILENSELIVSKEWTDLIPLTIEQVTSYSKMPFSKQTIMVLGVNRDYACIPHSNDHIFFDGKGIPSHIRIQIKHPEISGLKPVIAAGDFYVQNGKIVKHHPSGRQGIDNWTGHFLVNGPHLKTIVESIFYDAGYSEATGLFYDKAAYKGAAKIPKSPKISNHVCLKPPIITPKQLAIGHEKNSFSFTELKKEPVHVYVKHNQKNKHEAKHFNTHPKNNHKLNPTNILEKQETSLLSDNSTPKNSKPGLSHTPKKINNLVSQKPNYSKPCIQILDKQPKRLYERKVTYKNPVIDITKTTNKLNSNPINYTKSTLPVLKGLLILWNANTLFHLDKEMHPEVSNVAHSAAVGLEILINCTFPLTAIIGELANGVKHLDPESLQTNREFLRVVCENYDLSNETTEYLLHDFDNEGLESRKFIQAAFDNTRICLTPFEIFHDAKMLLVDGIRYLANYGHQSATKETLHALKTLNQLQQDIALATHPVNQNTFHGDIISATRHSAKRFDLPESAIEIHRGNPFNQNIINAFDTNLSFNHAHNNTPFFFMKHAQKTDKQRFHPLEAASVNTIPPIGSGQPVQSAPLIPGFKFEGVHVQPLSTNGAISGGIISAGFSSAPQFFPIVLAVGAIAFGIERIVNHRKNKEIQKIHRRTDRQCKQVADKSNMGGEAYNRVIKKIDHYNNATTPEERSKLTDEILLDIEKADKIFEDNQAYFANHMNQKNKKMDYAGKHHEHHQKKPTKKTLDYIKKSSKQIQPCLLELRELSSNFVALKQIKRDVDSLNSLYSHYNDSLNTLVTQLFNNEISLKAFQTYWTVIVNTTYTDASHLEQRIKENPHYDNKNDHSLSDIKSNILKSKDSSQYLVSYYVTQIEEANKPSYDAINHLSYAHLAADCMFKLKLFHPILQRINDHFALTNPQTKCLEQSVISMDHFQKITSYGFDLYKEAYAIQVRENLPSANRLIELANITPQEQIDSIHSLFRQTDENSLMNSANHFFASYNNTLLQGKLMVSFTDFILYLIYVKYQNTHSNNTLAFDEWKNEQANKNTLTYSATKMYDAFKLSLIGVSVAHSAFHLFQLYQSGANPLTLTRSVTHTLLSLSRLIDLKKWFSIGNEESTHQYLFQLFSHHLIGNDYQQLFNNHDETILKGVAKLLQKSSFIETYFDASGWLKHHKEQILNVCFVGNLMQGVAKTIMNANDYSHLAHIQTIHRQIDKMTQLQQTLNTEGHNAQLASLYCDLKYAALHLHNMNPQRLFVYVDALYKQHYFEHSIEIPVCDKDGNGFFQAVSCYTPKSPEELRKIAANYILAHTEFFREFIVTNEYNSIEDYHTQLSTPGHFADELMLRALSKALSRPIIVVYSDLLLDFQRQGLNSPNDITAGDPIYVLYDPINEQYQSLKIRGELYFEEQLSEKTPEPCAIETVDETLTVANQVLEEAQKEREETINKKKEIDTTLASISLLPKKNGFTLFSNFHSMSSMPISTNDTGFSVT